MLKQIKESISYHLDNFEPFFKKNMGSNIRLLDLVTNYILRRKGKQLRPMLVFLSAGACGQINQSTYVAASMVELLHTATLVHDDVVDEAYERRGVFSVYALWRSKVSVLVGDFILSRGLLVAVENNQFEMLRVISGAVKDMSEGELLQIERSRKMNIDEDTYYEIIRKKTASLIASCCTNGALSVNASADLVNGMKDYGQNLGMAFQIRDDLFDYQSSGLIGKPTGNDIKEHKLTLPLIYAFSQSDSSEKRRIVRLINGGKKSNIVKIVDFAKRNGGIDYAKQKMLDYRDSAKKAIESFPESEYKRSLLLLADYIVNREK